ncbi:tetratricopeptide repeat protein [Streptomyces sp. NPDC048565]|uniref:tetratricopeptide repeat protein n=1 Tax=Streptomyces sp. NPDC048565 TaxID=3155266 RepID=UPI00343FEB2C
MDPQRAAPGSASASGHGRVYQAQRDQYVDEHHQHHHYAAAPDDWMGPVPHSVRVPLTAEPATALRDRGELRERLMRSVTHGRGGPAQVLQGMAGCGKTALARHVLTRAVEHEGVIGFWVDASSATTLLSFMIGIAADRGASPDELETAHRGRRPASDLAWEYLDRSGEPWLLVLDNADEPGLLRDGGWLRRSPRGTVLVTTRDTASEIWRSCDTWPMGVLPLSAAAQLLFDLAPEAGAPEDYERLAFRLDRHPLALSLAGNHLRRQLLERWTVSDYLDRLPEDPSELLDQASDPSEEHARARFSSTWQLSLDALERQQVPEAVTLLRLLSCFAAQPATVPLGLLSPARLDATALPRLDPPLAGARADAALQGLVATSLVSLLDVPGDRGRPPVHGLQAHGLLLDTVAGRMPPEIRDDLVRSAAGLLEAALPDVADDQDLRLLAPHAIALLRRARGAEPLALVRRLRSLHYERGQFTAALDLAVATWRFSRELFGAEHTEALTDACETGRAQSALGLFAEAEQTLRGVLTAREAVLGPEDPLTLDTLHALGIALYGLGRWDEDEQLLRRALEGRERILGGAHPDTLDTRGRLAEAVGELGRWDEARTLARTTLDHSKAALGPRHPNTVLGLLAYAWAVAGQERWDEAAPLARETVHAAAEVFGPDHPRALAARHLHATVLIELRRWDEAEETLRHVITARESMLGPAHSHTLSARTDLAAVLTGSGRAGEATASAEATLDGYVRTLGPDHPRTRRCRAVLRAAREACAAAPAAEETS